MVSHSAGKECIRKKVIFENPSSSSQKHQLPQSPPAPPKAHQLPPSPPAPPRATFTMPRSGSQRRQRAARAARAARATPGQSGAASQRTLADILGNALVEARADEAAAVVARDNAAANLDLVLVLTRCLTTALHAASQMVRVATAAHESASSEQALAALNDALVVEMAARTAYKEAHRALCNARSQGRCPVTLKLPRPPRAKPLPC